jgi:hypothetical protein
MRLGVVEYVGAWLAWRRRRPVVGETSEDFASARALWLLERPERRRPLRR